MANNLMKVIAEEDGHCCVFNFFRSYGIIGQNNLSIKEAEKLADRIGVTPRTIYNWNRRIRDGECKCEKHAFCPNQRINAQKP